MLLPLPKQQKIDLFVFAGQSNMMGAAHLPPEDNPVTYYAFEYKYQPVLKGKSKGEFIYAQNPAGDWHYINTEKAYGATYLDVASGKSKLGNYSAETHFVPALFLQTNLLVVSKNGLPIQKVLQKARFI